MARQRKALRRRQRAHGALAFMQGLAHALRGQRVVGQPVALISVLEQILAGVIGVRQLHGVGQLVVDLGAGLAGLHRAVVPSGQAHGIGAPGAALPPGLDGVFGLGRVGALELDALLRAGFERSVVVGDDDGMPAGLALARLVLDPIEQPFFGQQALDKGVVSFAVLDGQAAFRVGVAVLHFPAPLRRHRTLAVVVAKDAVDDLDHRQVLERVTVAPLAQQCQPRFDAQPIARKAAVRAVEAGLGHQAAPGTVFVAAQGGLQRHLHRLANQRLQRDVRIVGQRIHVQDEAAVAQLLGAVEPLRQQFVLAQRCAQVQQAIGLGEACAQQAGGG
ncbi:hypothetical protein G6F65_015398 [Rhizopus arrhizus]|nr:hypothetical protein G6F65_015398 [Rhizopus arrhizus]